MAQETKLKNYVAELEAELAYCKNVMQGMCLRFDFRQGGNYTLETAKRIEAKEGNGTAWRYIEMCYAIYRIEQLLDGNENLPDPMPEALNAWVKERNGD